MSHERVRGVTARMTSSQVEPSESRARGADSDAQSESTAPPAREDDAQRENSSASDPEPKAKAEKPSEPAHAARRANGTLLAGANINPRGHNQHTHPNRLKARLEEQLATLPGMPPPLKVQREISETFLGLVRAGVKWAMELYLSRVWPEPKSEESELPTVIFRDYTGMGSVEVRRLIADLAAEAGIRSEIAEGRERERAVDVEFTEHPGRPEPAEPDAEAEPGRERFEL